MRGRTAFGVVGLLALATVTACGDDDDDKGGAATTAASQPATTTGSTSTGSADAGDASEEDYIAAIVAQFTGDEQDDLQLSEQEADCVAPKWLDVITVERLHDKGITPDDIENDSGDAELSSIGLSESEAGTMIDAFDECDVDIHDEFIRSMAADGQITADQRDCLSDAIDGDLLRRLFVASLTKGDAGIEADQQLSGDFSAAIGKCVSTTSTT